jgi:hypothetical protein
MPPEAACEALPTNADAARAAAPRIEVRTSERRRT